MFVELGGELASQIQRNILDRLDLVVKIESLLRQVFDNNRPKLNEATKLTTKLAADIRQQSTSAFNEMNECVTHINKHIRQHSAYAPRFMSSKLICGQTNSGFIP